MEVVEHRRGLGQQIAQQQLQSAPEKVEDLAED